MILATYVPNGANPLTSNDWTVRLPCVVAMARIVASWPSTNTPFELPAIARVEQLEFEKLECRIWRTWSTIYHNYMMREAPLLYVCPAVLW